MSISSYRFQKAYRLSGLIFAGLMLVACTKEPENPAEAIYFGGEILTMAGEQPEYVEALAIDDGKISFIGSKLDADKLVGKATQKIDLHGATLIPSIISGVQQALTSQGATSAPNCWKDTTFTTLADVIKALKTALVERAKLGLGLFCMGYKADTSNPLATLTDADLDAAFPDISVVLVDASLQSVLANSVAKKQFSLETYKSLKNAMQKTDTQKIGLEVGQPADFMILDKNPLKDASLSLASIQITQAFSQGKLIPNAPKDLAMLALLDITAALAAENAARLKVDEMNAIAVTKATESAIAAKKLAAKKLGDAKAKTKESAQLNSKAATNAQAKQAAKRSNAKTQLTKKPEPVQAQPTTEPSKPREVRFNMTQNGKKMTPEDFDAWMKAQGIRIVPAKPVEAVPPVDKK